MKIDRFRPLLRSFVLASLAAAAMLAAATSASAVTAGNTGWEWSSPFPQGNSLTTVETVDGRIYAGGANGTLIRSDDAGFNWTGVRTGLLDGIKSIRAITPDSIVFSGRCALRRSDDGGNTVRRLAWGPSDDSCGSEIAAFYFPTGIVGYLMLKNGEIFATSDGGETWARKTSAPGSDAASGPASVGDIWFTSASEGVISVGSKVFRTADSANSWTPVVDATLPINAFEFVSPTQGLAVGDGGATITTSNGGANWTIIYSMVPPGETFRALSCATAMNCLGATADNQRIVTTNTGGHFWTSVTASPVKLAGVGLVNATRGIAVGESGAIVATDNFGASWAHINGGVAGEFNDVSAANANNAVATGKNAALARSADGGRSWRPVNVSTTADVLDAAFVGDSRGYVLDSLGTVLRTDNDGSSWRFFSSGSKARPKAMHAVDESTVLLVGPRGVRRSTNGAERFTAVGDRKFRRLSFRRIDVAGKSLFVYGSRSVATSSSRGRKWKRVKVPRAVRSIRRLDMLSARTGYLLDTRNELWFTRTSGKKWKRIETTGAGKVTSMAFGNRKNGYLTSSDGRVLVTTNAGSSWSRQYPFYEANSTSPTLVAAPTGKSAILLVGGTNRIFNTTTGGSLGTPSKLSIKSSSRRVRKRTVIKVTGKLTPAIGGERVTVLARALGSKRGTGWTSQERPVSPSGSFTTSWRVSRPTIFIARWSGDSDRAGAGARSIKVLIRR